MRRLKDCSDQDVLILTAIVTLAKQLPYELTEYTRVFGEMTQRYFSSDGSRRPRRDHNPSPGSLALTHKPRATQPWR